ncbi:hypothetical protein PFICI_06286 [Pestalotiopsis fici W106-1]|uniref:NAD-dependent epimerase/dehydratase domain-containing protein n=1 Tax=Pestalotiopsis fici (strain W106-1 / CGMCC3.15140) TaxID=1229662 RepID=W3X5K6_PESFW|nr:uncharacterized protein PFICI_06286 [Pestalotiopsis fici W106-1]ETS81284.1 hypothetical protein PFICI_06286 [Pestalotiopsis fici W106-1]
MSSPKLLITGTTGFIGFKVLLGALKAGYHVRATLRSLGQKDTIAKHPQVTALGLPADRLEFVEVQDICSDKAYQQAIKGIEYVIHLASPLPSPFLDPQTGIYEPNIKSATSILNNALEEPSIKKLVIASSVFANSPFPPDGKKITADSRIPDFPGPFDAMLPAYSMGKAGALNATDRFVKEKNPHFKVVNVFPGFVFGTDERALKSSDIFAGTNRILLAAVTGQNAEMAMPAGATHVYDAATLFLTGLQDDAPTNIGASVPQTFDDAWPIVQKHFPEAVSNGLLTRGSQPTAPVHWDSTQTEIDIKGFKFRTYEDMVVDTVAQYLDLLAKEKQ